jgi:hypothetical protein
MLDSLSEFYFKGIGILWNIIFLWTALGLQKCGPNRSYFGDRNMW